MILKLQNHNILAFNKTTSISYWCDQSGQRSSLLLHPIVSFHLFNSLFLSVSEGYEPKYCLISALFEICILWLVDFDTYQWFIQHSGHYCWATKKIEVFKDVNWQQNWSVHTMKSIKWAKKWWGRQSRHQHSMKDPQDTQWRIPTREEQIWFFVTHNKQTLRKDGLEKRTIEATRT